MYRSNNPISFLTPKENEVMQHLVNAYNAFAELTLEDQQATNDLFDFGHYMNAAQSVLLVRGARRMDPDNLLKKDHER